MRHGPTQFDRLGGKFTKLARVFSREYGVVVNMRGTACNTDGTNVINIPANADYLEDTDQEILEGMLDHEWSHVYQEKKARLRQKEWRSGPKPRTPMECMRGVEDGRERLMLNVFEDIRIEVESSKKYPGVAVNLRRLHRFMAKKCNADPVKWTNGGDFWKTIGLGIISRANEEELLEEWAPAVVIDILDNVINEEIGAAKKTMVVEECLELALRVVRKLDEYKETLVEEMKRRSEAGDDDGEEGGSGLKIEINEDEEEGKGDEEEEEDEDEEEEGDGLAGKSDDELSDLEEALKYEDDDREVPKSLLDDVKKELEEAAVEEAMVSGRYIPFPAAMDLDYWFTPELGDEAHYASLREEVAPQVAALRAKISTVLRTRIQRRHVGDRESGALDSSVLYSLRTGNRRVFTEVIPESSLNTAVQIIVDLSGSMAHRVRTATGAEDRVYFARLTCIALGETLSSLRVPFEIIGWDNDRVPADMTGHLPGVHSRFAGFRYWKFKEYGEKWRGVRRRLLGMSAGFANVDGEAIMTAALRLASRPEKRKILFVFSDGQPAGGCDHGQNLKNLHDSVRKITSAGIEVVGLGVQTEAVETYYSKANGAESIVFRNLSELAPGVFKVLGRKMLAGRAA